MGKIQHANVGTELTKIEFEADSTHKDSQGNTLEIPRSATLIVAASDALARSKAGADLVCTGVDDQEQVNAAIAALTGGKRGRIALSDGKFVLSDSINLPQIDRYSGDGLVIQGAGRGATELEVNHGTGAFRYSSATLTNYIEIRDLEINCNGRQYGLYLDGMTFCTFKNLEIHHGDNGAGIFMEDLFFNQFENISSVLHYRGGGGDTGWGIRMGSSGHQVNGNTFIHVIAALNRGGGIRIEAAFANAFYSCGFEGHGWTPLGIAIHFFGSTRANLISNAYFENQADADIVMAGAPRKNVIDACYSYGIGGDYFVHLEEGELISIRDCMEISHGINSVLIDAGVNNTRVIYNDFETAVADNGAGTIIA